MILVDGCPRSGTSITGELLRDHPNCLRYAFEEWWPFSGVSLATPDTVAKTPKHQDAPLGLAYDIDSLPDGPVIWVIRHPLDTICSLRPVMEERWAYRPIPDPPVTWWERGARLWALINGIGYARLSTRRPDHISVRYEDLIANPHATARRILDYVGWPYDDTSEAWANRVSDSPEDGGHADFQTFWSERGPKHDIRVGRWKHELTPKQVADIERIVSSVAYGERYDLCA